MREIDVLLEELSAQQCVRGCAVVTSDGIAVASRLHDRFREDVVVGLTSFLVQTTRRALDEAEDDPVLDRFVLHATHGKILNASLGDAWLVAITDQFARLDDLLPTFDSVLERMRVAARLAD